MSGDAEVYLAAVMRQVAAAVVVGMVMVWVSAAGGAAAQGRSGQEPTNQGPSNQGAVPQGEQRANEPRKEPPPPARWWRVYQQELKLTPDQVSRIDAIFEATFPTLRTGWEDLNKREEKLSALISADDATEAQVLALSHRIEAIRGELSKTRVLMLFRMRRVLSPEQRTKLQAIQAARRGQDRERR